MLQNPVSIITKLLNARFCLLLMACFICTACGYKGYPYVPTPKQREELQAKEERIQKRRDDAAAARKELREKGDSISDERKKELKAIIYATPFG